MHHRAHSASSEALPVEEEPEGDSESDMNMLAAVKSRKLEGSTTPLIAADEFDSEDAGAGGHADSCPSKLLALAGVVITLVGLGFGLSMPSALEGKGSTTVHYLSSVIGWTYFAVWSVSFYPQLYLNWARKSVVGLSFDFELYNLVGFAFYSVFNCAFYYDPNVQAAYMAANDGKKNLVQANDVFFALHATFITVLTIVQCFVYERGGQTISRQAGISICGVSGITLLYFVLVRSAAGGGGGGGFFSTLHWLYWLSYVKLGITVVKYIPQVLLNRRRRSTSGWNIYNVLLDFSGGLLSIVQLLLDASVEEDWSGVAGDPVKLGLGMASLVFDVIFMLQHYVWYPQKGASAAAGGSAGDRDKLGGSLVTRASATLLERGTVDITSIDTPQAKRLQALPSSSLSQTLRAVSGEVDPGAADLEVGLDDADADAAVKLPKRAPSR